MSELTARFAGERRSQRRFVETFLQGFFFRHSLFWFSFSRRRIKREREREKREQEEKHVGIISYASYWGISHRNAFPVISAQLTAHIKWFPRASSQFFNLPLPPPPHSKGKKRKRKRKIKEKKSKNILPSSSSHFFLFEESKTRRGRC